MTRFLEEISQMPAALELVVSFYEEEGRDALSAFRRLVEAALSRGERDSVWSGMGTSRFAPEAVFPRLARRGLGCRTADAGEWLHYGAAAAPGLVVLTSQSGESVEVRRLLEQGLVRPGYVAITNDTASTLGRGAAVAFPLLAGDEASISNKTYANTLAVLHLMAAALEGDDALERAFHELRAAARALLDADEQAIAAAAGSLAGGSGIAFVGRGPAYVAARQCALTFMEGARCLASAFTGGAFNHGPAETLDRGFRLVILQASGRTRRLTESLAARASGLGAEVTVLGEPPAGGEGVPGVRRVPVPSLEGAARDREELFPLLSSRVQNLLLHEVAAARGHEAGIFRHGGKVTTNE